MPVSRNLLLVVLLASSNAFSGWYIEGGLGRTDWNKTNDDGVWYQEPFPHSFSLTSTSERLGIGHKWKEWGLTLSWVDLGSNGAHSEAIIPDSTYHECKFIDASKCKTKKETFSVTGHAKGPELTVSRYFGDLYLKGGYFRWFHSLDADVSNYPSYKESAWRNAYVAGGGINHKFFFAELNYYCIFDGRHETGGYPLAKSAFVPMIGVRIPLK